MPYAGRKDLGEDAVRTYFHQRNLKDEMDFRKARAEEEDAFTRERLRLDRQEAGRRADRDQSAEDYQNKALGLSQQRIGIDQAQEARQTEAFNLEKQNQARTLRETQQTDQAGYAGAREQVKSLLTEHPEMLPRFQAAQRFLQSAEGQAMPPKAKMIFAQKFAQGIETEAEALSQKKIQNQWNDLLTTGAANGPTEDPRATEAIHIAVQDPSIPSSTKAKLVADHVNEQSKRRAVVENAVAGGQSLRNLLANSGATPGSPEYKSGVQAITDFEGQRHDFETAERLVRGVGKAAASQGPKPSDIRDLANDYLADDLAHGDPKKPMRFADAWAKAKQELGGAGPEQAQGGGEVDPLQAQVNALRDQGLSMEEVRAKLSGGGKTLAPAAESAVRPDQSGDAERRLRGGILVNGKLQASPKPAPKADSEREQYQDTHERAMWGGPDRKVPSKRLAKVETDAKAKTANFSSEAGAYTDVMTPDDYQEYVRLEKKGTPEEKAAFVAKVKAKRE